MHLPNNTLLQGGKYKIVRFISAGGFGCTYKGVHTMLDSRVAIKEFFVKDFCNRDENSSHITLGTQSKAELLERLRRKFIDEAKAVFKMRHMNIVRVTDIFEENGTAYYVMDYIDGMSLKDIVEKRGAQPENKALKYILQIADALKYVHSQNRLHLDIKPGNIMVDAQDNAYLIDFGTSKQYDEVGCENTFTIPAYTVGYAPIEQSKQNVTTFSEATDIYALGATFYKLLTGVTPPNAVDLISEEETLSPLPSSVSENVRKTVEKAMEVKRKDRPQSVDELVSLFSHIETKPTPVRNDMVNDEVTIVAEPLLYYDKHTDKIVFGNKSYKMILVEGGKFDMIEKGFWSDRVQHVTFDDYSIGETAVPQWLWEAVMGDNPSYFKGENKPMENITWEDSQKFIERLNQITGMMFSLPTEAQWEFAARGGNLSKGFKFSGSNQINEVAWSGYCNVKETHDVAMLKPNEIGLFDMSGNVWEMCSDWYDEYRNGTYRNPQGVQNGETRVMRGGSWATYYEYCINSVRSNCPLNVKSLSIGFRLAIP